MTFSSPQHFPISYIVQHHQRILVLKIDSVVCCKVLSNFEFNKLVVISNYFMGDHDKLLGITVFILSI